MTSLKRKLASLELVPSDRGRFEVSIDGTLVYSKLKTGEFPDDMAIVQTAGKSAKASDRARESFPERGARPAAETKASVGARTSPGEARRENFPLVRRTVPATSSVPIWTRTVSVEASGTSAGTSPRNARRK